METTIIIASTVLAFAIFLSVYFRDEVRKLFPRIKNIGAKGVSLSESQSNLNEETKITFEQQFDTHSRSLVQVQKEEQIRKELDERGIRDDAERSKMLTRALATTIISSDCERVSLLIFGSQLEFLIELNAHADGMKVGDIEDWYVRSVQPNYPDLREKPFADYFGFLTGQGLVIEVGDSAKVTAFATEFMQYLVRTGKTHRRKN